MSQQFLDYMWSINPFNYSRRPSLEVRIGKLFLGGKQALRLQSMANTDTNNTPASIEQAVRIIEAGGELVRFTAQGIREAENLKFIREGLDARGYASVPLVADIHFTPNAAEVAALHVEKVRINPGNYVKSVKRGNASEDYSEEEFRMEQERIRERFLGLLAICKKEGRAIRIGVNHGSLSERMMNRYGDTPEGMVVSCMEFLRICREEGFNDVVISMKTSNTVMMVQSVRLLVDRLSKEDLNYPLHLGVTEAGDGEDGRIKSAVGIGALLLDGIGDTIRVSLSEDPECEIPVAKQLAAHALQRNKQSRIEASISPHYSPFEYRRRETLKLNPVGGANPPVVIASRAGNYDAEPDFRMLDGKLLDKDGKQYNIASFADLQHATSDKHKLLFVNMSLNELSEANLKLLCETKNLILLLRTVTDNPVGEQRAFFHRLLDAGCKTPVVICRSYAEDSLEALQIKAACDIGVLFIDGFGDGILLENKGSISPEELNSIAFGILQATRVRSSKTEYISCPSCGRTLFDLQAVNARIKARTAHLKGLKIGIMGCIVNGPGEMADADYGYVGTGKGKISLYKKKECVERNIPEEEAVDKLIELIKINGDWHENCQ